MSIPIRDSLIALMRKHWATWVEKAFDGNYTFLVHPISREGIAFGFDEDTDEDEFLRQAEMLLDTEGTRALPQGEVLWKIARQAAQHEYILTKGEIELAAFTAECEDHTEEIKVPEVLALAEWVRDPSRPGHFHFIPREADRGMLQKLVQLCPPLPRVIGDYIKAFGSCTSDGRDLPVLMFRSQIEATQFFRRLNLTADVSPEYQARLLEVEIEYAEQSLAEKKRKLAALRGEA